MRNCTLFTEKMAADCHDRVWKFTRAEGANQIVRILLFSNFFIWVDALLDQLFSLLFSFLKFFIKLMPRFVILSIVDKNASVSICAIASFKVGPAYLRVVIDSGRGPQEAGSIQWAQRAFETFHFQLLLCLRNVLSVSWFSAVYFWV